MNLNVADLGMEELCTAEAKEINGGIGWLAIGLLVAGLMVCGSLY
jgi:hypothetical protein